MVNSVLSRYGLPDGHTILANPPSKNAWKETCTTAIESYWYNKLTEGSKHKSSLRHISWDPKSCLKPHHVWTVTVDPNTKDVQGAAIKARLITRTYTLQEQRAKFYPEQESCPLCEEEPESRSTEPFVLRCQRLQVTRQEHLQQVREAVSTNYTYVVWDTMQTHDSLQRSLFLTVPFQECYQQPPSVML